MPFAYVSWACVHVIPELSLEILLFPLGPVEVAAVLDHVDVITAQHDIHSRRVCMGHWHAQRTKSEAYEVQTLAMHDHMQVPLLHAACLVVHHHGTCGGTCPIHGCPCTT